MIEGFILPIVCFWVFMIGVRFGGAYLKRFHSDYTNQTHARLNLSGGK